MYKTIVARKVRGVFRALSVRDTKPMLATLAPRFEYRFAGEGAFSGLRTSVAEIEQWWERVYALLPELVFEPRSVVVQGFPWNTTVATHVVVRGKQADGEPYLNEFMQVMRLAWGRATRIDTLEDTHRLQRAFDRLADKGFEAAAAPPIGQPAGIPS